VRLVRFLAWCAWCAWCASWPGLVRGSCAARKIERSTVQQFGCFGQVRVVLRLES